MGRQKRSRHYSFQLSDDETDDNPKQKHRTDARVSVTKSTRRRAVHRVSQVFVTDKEYTGTSTDTSPILDVAVGDALVDIQSDIANNDNETGIIITVKRTRNLNAAAVDNSVCFGKPMSPNTDQIISAYASDNMARWISATISGCYAEA
jgi:hypothetical protein